MVKKFKSSKVEKLKSANLSTWLLFLLFNLSTFQPFNTLAKTFDVDISTGRPAASNEAYYHGETIEFRAVRGRSVVTNVEYSCVYYQTNGMDIVWWHTDGLVFHPTNDVGAASYRFFLEGRDDLGRDWHANGLLRLLPSPGFTPNTIELPVARLDFAAVDVLNPPWTDPDFSTNNAALVETIEATAPAPGDYAAVSNAAVHAAITNALQDAAITTLASSVSMASASATNYVDSATNDVLVAAQGYTDEKISEIPAPDFTTNNVELVETIEATAPAPGNYAAVSNAAVYAAITNAQQDAALARKLSLSGGEMDRSAKITWSAGGMLGGAEYSISRTGVQRSSTTPGTSWTKAWDAIAETSKTVPISCTVNGKALSEDVTLTGADIAVSGSDATKIDAALADKQDKLPYPTNSIPYAAISGKPSLATVATSGSYNDLSNKPTIPTVPTAQINAATTTNALQDAAIADKADKSDVDPLLFAQYYPDGSVKSAAEFTPGIQYDFDTANHTAMVKPFCSTGDSEYDNSGLSGRVVIPPFVDGDGNGYISDDGTRYKVVGVSDGSTYDVNVSLTAIVAPNTVTDIRDCAFNECEALASVSLPAATSIGDSAFCYCDLTSVSLPAAQSIGDDAFSGSSLTSVSLPAATSIGGTAFYSCGGLTSVDFGDTPRSSVPTLGSFAFFFVSTSCKIIVPYAQYDEWIAADGWKSLTQEFVRHAEKADKPATFTAGNLAEFDANGNPTDSLIPVSNVATKAMIDAGDVTFSNAVVSVAGGMDTTYRMVVGLTNVNQTVQYVDAPASATELAIRLPADGNTKDWIVYVVAATNMTLSLPPATWWMADTAYTNALEATSKTALYFSQVTAGTYILGRQKMEAVTIQEAQ